MCHRHSFGDERGPIDTAVEIQGGPLAALNQQLIKLGSSVPRTEATQSCPGDDQARGSHEFDVVARSITRRWDSDQVEMRPYAKDPPQLEKPAPASFFPAARIGERRARPEPLAPQLYCVYERGRGPYESKVTPVFRHHEDADWYERLEGVKLKKTRRSPFDWWRDRRLHRRILRSNREDDARMREERTRTQ